ncbi:MULTISPECIES: hypothetical protein [unclassified Streptomyces]|uniref:hypothetical protein n=1 Tax=unclassified Streptomyces TaxID=2593676 RepID=UPI00236699CA|nr:MULTISPECIES: hypothetical protein [unclassified Streptomyces]MDF3148396.1 hypothetical protein [Streptomyces sp. T21Q-yed]WDF40922.1 hypothetical protein PBV52_31160 [Streptomyces sp. T12]
MAGIGTLLFTGIATYYGARVSQGQLQQSQEDAERDARDQAAHLAFWIGNEEDLSSPGGKVSSVHVMNRSPDPVTEVTVAYYVDVYEQNDKEEVVHIQRGYYFRELRSMPPCSEAIFETDPWWVEELAEHPHGLLTAEIVVRHVTFTDREGVDWVRDSRNLAHAEGTENSRHVPKPKPDHEVKPRTWISLGSDTPKFKQATSCGDRDDAGR